MDIITTFEMKFSTAPQLRRGNREAIEALGVKQNYIVAPVDGIDPAGEKLTVVGLAEALTVVKNL